jgi:hypothetical protein
LSERVEVYSYHPKKLVGTISRFALKAAGLTADSDRISATTTQLTLFKQLPTWEEAK